MDRTNIQMLAAVARAFGDLRDRVAFLGGAAVELYATDAGAPRPRPTMDVDCIVDVPSRADYHRLEEMLRARGFRHDLSTGAPICRWLWDDIMVDVMPTRGDIIGFANDWYEEGLRTAVSVPIEDGLSVRILDAPHFLAAKFAALRDRGMRDLRTSPDFEDIVFVLRNRRAAAAEIGSAGTEVRAFLRTGFRELLSLSTIDEAIAAVLDRGEPIGAQARVREVMESI